MPYNASTTAIGIDLGTTRCCVSVIRLNGIQTVALENTGGRLLPSYVSYNGGNVKCGQIVVDRLRYFPKSTIFDSKRIIGRNLNEIEIDSFWPFSLLEIDRKLFLEVKKQNGQGCVTAEEVASELLKYMKAKTEVFQGTKLSKAVITVPAAYSETQKEATMKATKMAASLNNSKLEANQVHKVLLVGGGSRMPMIKQLLRNMFPEAEHCIEEHPEEVVAIGASYYAYTVF
uniref:Uncharacterized protein n=1 Tax=Panagrolaimus davidi TaxID=227884 RepID=A0A914PDD7_9BILA